MNRPLPPADKRRQRGFTLLETVVTLVVVSMLVAMLMQALNHALSLRTRIARVQAEARTDLLQEAWFREAVATAQADLEDAMGSMQGSSTELAYATPMPLVANGMSRVRWWLQREGDGLALHYSDPATPDLTIVRGPLQEASFAYLDHEGQWHEQWNPAPDDRQRLPRLVRFQASTGKGELFWLVPLLADPIPADMMRPDQFMSGGGDGI